MPLPPDSIDSAEPLAADDEHRLIEWSCPWSWGGWAAGAPPRFESVILLAADPGGRLSAARAALPLASSAGLLALCLAQETHAERVLEAAADAAGVEREAQSPYFGSLGGFLKRSAPFLSGAWANASPVGWGGPFARWRLGGEEGAADGVDLGVHLDDCMRGAGFAPRFSPAQCARRMAEAAMLEMESLAELAFGRGCVLASAALPARDQTAFKALAQAALDRQALARELLLRPDEAALASGRSATLRL